MAKKTNTKIKPIKLFAIVDKNKPVLKVSEFYEKDQIKDIWIHPTETVVEIICQVKEK